MKKKVIEYHLFSVSKDKNDKVVSKLEDTFFDMMEAVEEAHKLMKEKATATKIQPKAISVTSH